jgi:hypothetical protein
LFINRFSNVFSGDQGDVWRRYESISLFKPTPFQIVIEGTVGASYQGDIAIDDLSFTPGCIIDSTTTLNPTGFTVPTSITCHVGQMRYRRVRQE